MSSSQLINDAIRAQAAAAGLRDIHRTDAGETLFTVRALEDISAVVYEQLFPDLMGRKLIPVVGGINPGATTHTWRQYTKLGEAEETDDYGEDVPEVEIEGSERHASITGIRNSYGFSIMDLRSASMAGVPLDSMKATTARDIMERKLDRMLALGSKYVAKNGITGLFNAPNVDALDVTTVNHTAPASGFFSASDCTKWDFSAAHGKTPLQVVADLNQARANVRNNSLGIHNPDSALFDVATDTYMDSTPVNIADPSIYSSETVKSFIMKSCTWLKNWEVWNQAGTASATGKARGLVYEKNARNFGMILPQDFEQFAPQLKGMRFSTQCHMRSGGVIVRYPKAFQYVDKHQG